MLSLKDFIEKINNNEYSKDTLDFMSLMNDANNNQHYLNNKNFKILQEYLIFCKMLKSQDSTSLNPAQQAVIRNYEEHLTANITPAYAISSSDEGGTTLTYKPNGFISAAFIIGTTISFGLAIAYVFISGI